MQELTGDHAKSARTVRRIVQAALHLYREIGHKKTTVADIARISSMSSANIYRFLEARQAVEDFVVKQLLEETANAATETARNGSSALSRPGRDPQSRRSAQ